MPEITLEDVYNAIQSGNSILGILQNDISVMNSNLNNIWNLLHRSILVPKAATLISEYFGAEDLDNNGLIFGYDFYISNPPKMLESIEFDTTPVSAMTWEEYLE